MINNNSFETNNNQESDYKLVDALDQKLIEMLLKGYTNKRIALEAKSPLSTIQMRIRRIFENQYIHKKTELNYKKLGLRKAYLFISLNGDDSNVAQKISIIKGITCVSLVAGNVDILSTCVFRETTDLFNIIQSVKTIQKVDKVSWAEEVHDISTKEITMSFQESINTSAAISKNVQMTN